MKSRSFTTLVDATDLSADTRYYSLGSQRTTELVVGMVCTGGVTVTIEATMFDDPESGDWVDITKSFYSLSTGNGGHGNGGMGAASYVDKTDILTLCDGLRKSARVKVVTSDATNTVKIVVCEQGDNIQISS